MKKQRQHLDDMMEVVRAHPPLQPLLEDKEVLDALHGSSSLPSHHHHNLTGKTIMSITVIILGIGALLWWMPKGEEAGESARKPESTPVTEHIIPSPEKNSSQGGLAERVPGAGEVVSEHSLLQGRKGGGKKGGEEKMPEEETITDPRQSPGIYLSDLTPEELRRIGILSGDGRLRIDEERTMPTQLFFPSSSERKSLEKLGYKLDGDSVRIHSQTLITLGANPQIKSLELGPSEEKFPFEPTIILLTDDSRENTSTVRSGSRRPWLSSEDQEALRKQLRFWVTTEPEEEYTGPDVLGKFIPVYISWTSKLENGSRKNQHLYLWYSPTPDFFAALPERYRTEELRERVEYMQDLVRNDALNKGGGDNSSSANTAANSNLRTFGGTVARNYSYLSPGMSMVKHSSSFAEHSHFDRSRDIDGITFLNLTPDELEKIGVEINTAGLAFQMQQRISTYYDETKETMTSLGYDVSSPFVPVLFRMAIDTFSTDYHAVEKNMGNGRNYCPVLYSSYWVDMGEEAPRSGLSMVFTNNAPVIDYLGEGNERLLDEIKAAYYWKEIPDDDMEAIWYDLEQNDTSELHRELFSRLTSLNRLVPVRVLLKSGEYLEEAGTERGAEVLLWYVPTSGFINDLPERYREPLRRELDVIASVEAEGLPSHEVCNRVAGETILGLCRSSSGAIRQTSVWPNPIQSDGEFTLNYELDADREVSLTLHDLSGRFIQEIRGAEKRKEGKQSESARLNNVSSGTYLVAIRTEKGETAVQRIVVQ